MQPSSQPIYTGLEASPEAVLAYKELIELGLSPEEISNLYKQVDGIIEREFDTYFSNLYE